MLASLNGQVLDAAEATVPITDDGLLRGDGVFEVVRLYGGVPYAMDEHLARMSHSAGNLRLPFAAEQFEQEALALVQAAEPGEATMLRMVCTRGGNRIITVEPLPASPETLALVTVRYSPTRVMDGIKSLSYGANMLVSRLAKEQGADEALLVTPHGRVLEGPRQSFVASLDGETLVTPPLDDHVLDSITRRRLLESGLVTERPISADELPFAQEAFLASTTREVHAVSSIDGVTLPAAPGALTQRAAAAVHEVIQAAVGQPAGVKVLTVIGNRPQFVKAAAVSGPLRARHAELLVHTGQHYDDELSAIFVRELGMPRPELELGLGGGTNTEQTARMLAAIGPLLAEHVPDAVLVYGDTNSTLAGALAGAQARVPVAHVEAGMRSFDRAMPEELNRVLTDHASDLLLCPSQVAASNLAREGVAGHVEVVGDVMVDVAELVRPRAAADDAPLREAGVEPDAYVLVTAHRAGNVDDPGRLARLVDLLLVVPGEVVFPLHPRTRARLEASGDLARLQAGVRVLPPLGYVAFTALLTRASAVLTDSGGVQKEAYLAGVRCVTLRDTTEWVETVESGWNVLVDLEADAALSALERELPLDRPAFYGDGRAAQRVVAAIETLAG